MATTRIQIVSDLHLEIERDTQSDYDTFAIVPTAPILALLGDTGTVNEPRLFAFLRAQIARFRLVLFVLGNHEYYNGTVAHTVEVVRGFERTVRDEASCNPAMGKFVLLHRTSVQLSPSITALGCTFWSHLAPEIAEFTWAITDFKRIQDMDTEMYDSLHKEDRDWLQAEIARIRTEAPDQTVVVLTHHAPTREGTSDPKFAGGPTESAFVSEFSHNSLLWGPPIKVWAFGHTHWCCDFERNGVRLLSNQRGYKFGRENSTRFFDPGFVLEI